MSRKELQERKIQLEYILSPEVKELDDKIEFARKKLFKYRVKRAQISRTLLDNIEYREIVESLQNLAREHFSKRKEKLVDKYTEQKLSQTLEQIREIEPDAIIREDESCVVCAEFSRSISFDCGHKCICSKCAVKILENKTPLCPICRKNVKQAFRVFD